MDNGYAPSIPGAAINLAPPQEAGFFGRANQEYGFGPAPMPDQSIQAPDMSKPQPSWLDSMGGVKGLASTVGALGSLAGMIYGMASRPKQKMSVGSGAGNLFR